MALSFSQVICQVSLAQVSDVDKAVAAAKEAFENGLWGKINARDRGRLLYRCGSGITSRLHLGAGAGWNPIAAPTEGSGLGTAMIRLRKGLQKVWKGR